ncbi:MAG: ribose-phosphate pyrophosphokinase [Flavobacteriaceae bacterium]|nr:ribose-phosphate pyrophosphokinase [Flavobacteriaceae bacterium]
MFLDLDTSFTLFEANASLDFESFTFPGGEPHIKITGCTSGINEVTVTHRIQSFNDFGLLVLAVDALKRLSVEKINVFIPYFPAARQDRVMRKGEPLSVKVYAEILNNMGLNRISIYDPHSDVTPALLNKCSVISNHNFIKSVLQDIDEEVILISPDGGALKKIYQLSKRLGGITVVECSKSRDVKTGKLSGFQVYASDLQGRSCVVVDDICDGGSTFMGLAKELKAKNAGKLYLAVSHGIFSKGFDKLQIYYDHIYCTDAFRSIENTEQFKQIQLKEVLRDEIQ